jgi:hypothetical protein
MTQGEAAVSKIGTAIRVSWSTAWMEFDRLTEHGDDLSAEVTFYSLLPPRQGLLHRARFNLLSTSTRSGICKALEVREKGLPWSEMLEIAVWLVVENYREGDPAVDLRTVNPWPQDRWLLRPYIEHGGPTILFAEGGSGKSIIALWMGLRVALENKPVLYLDYETGPEVHAERMRALCAGMSIDQDAMPTVHYKRMASSLAQSLYVVRRDVDKLEAGMVIIDSLGAAGDGPPEESATAVALFQAIRTIPVPCLCIHHKRKSANGQKNENQRDRMFGSVYYVNFARLAWEMEAATEEDSGTITVGMINVKANNGRLQARHALNVEFTNTEDRLTEISVRPTDIRTEPGLAHRVSLRDRIMAELSHGPLDRKEVAAAMDTTPNAASVELAKMNKDGLLVQLPDNKWGLRTRDN